MNDGSSAAQRGVDSSAAEYDAPRANQVREHILVAALGLAALTFYKILIYQTQTIYWNDAHIRWALRDQLLLEEWLPGVQVFVFIASKTTSNLDFLQNLMSLVAIGTLISFYILARHLFSPQTGLIAFIFLAFNSMFAAFAIVPYSEMLFAGFVFLIFVLLDSPVFSKPFYFGVFLLNLACLTRYEGWFLAVFFTGEVALRSLRTMKWTAALWQTLKMTLLCSLTPMTWLTAGLSGSHGYLDRLSSIYEFVIAPATPNLGDHILARLAPTYSIYFSLQFFYLLIRQIHLEFLVLAMTGILSVIVNSAYRGIHFRILLFVIMDWSLLALLQPWKFGNLRQPFQMQVFLVLYASYGLVSVVSWASQRLALFIKGVNRIKWANYFLAVSVLGLMLRLIYSTSTFVVETSRESSFLTPFTVAKWLEPRLVWDDVILVIDDSNDYPYILASYLGYPLGNILDDRLDLSLIRANLQAAGMVYIIELYESRYGLSSAEIRLLNDLESGRISAEPFVLADANVWYVPANAVFYSP